MPVKLKVKELQDQRFNFNAIAFLPDQKERLNYCAVLTHGYTSSKSSIVSWAQRLSEANIPSVIFDLPGHLLGGINQVGSFEEFRDHSHECFDTAAKFLLEELGPEFVPEKYILGGHSLGAMLSLKAMNLERFESVDSLAVCVGLGVSQHKTTHLFESSFYQKTLNIRRQLVVPELDSDLVFPWIKDEKEDVSIEGKRAHLITGEDDVVVGKGGMQALVENLEENSNQVSFHEPKKLPHHEPGMASSHVYHFLKKELGL